MSATATEYGPLRATVEVWAPNKELVFIIWCTVTMTTWSAGTFRILLFNHIWYFIEFSSNYKFCANANNTGLENEQMTMTVTSTLTVESFRWFFTWFWAECCVIWSCCYTDANHKQESCLLWCFNITVVACVCCTLHCVSQLWRMYKFCLFRCELFYCVQFTFDVVSSMDP